MLKIDEGEIPSMKTGIKQPRFTIAIELELIIVSTTFRELETLVSSARDFYPRFIFLIIVSKYVVKPILESKRGLFHIQT